MNITDFDYLLPEELIAKRPLENRSSSKLLVLHRNGLTEHRFFSDITDYLSSGDLLIINNTKVFPAKLVGKRSDGKPLEILLVREIEKDLWEVLSKGRITGNIHFTEDFRAELLDGSTAKFYHSGNLIDLLWRYGYMPLPQYIKRAPDKSDRETYQTSYAKQEGSIAAPTAGLHFTPELLEKIQACGTIVRELTLHVGVGTFKPVRTEEVEEHIMGKEYFEIEKALLHEIQSVKEAGKRVFAVGTTSTRALEGFLSGRCDASSSNGRIKGATDLFIYPGFSFRVVDSLITNFHLPRSTPLMLAAAKCGLGLLLKTYSEAVAMGYRFLSYGDAMLIL